MPPGSTRSSVLVRTVLNAPGITVVFTSPTDRFCLIKTVTFFNAGGSSGEVGLGSRSGGTADVFWLVRTDLASNKMAANETWSVLEPGDELVAFGAVPPTRVAVYGTILR